MAKEKENLKNIKTDELRKKLMDTEESIRVLRFNTEGSKSKNVKEVLNLKRQVARLLTEINNKK